MIFNILVDNLKLLYEIINKLIEVDDNIFKLKNNRL